MEETDIITREEIRKYLYSTGITRQAFAERVGVSLETVNQWMSNRNIPRKKQEIIRKLFFPRTTRTPSAVASMSFVCLPVDKADIERAAALAGEKVEEFCLRAVRRRAQAVLSREEVKRDTTSGGIR